MTGRRLTLDTAHTATRAVLLVGFGIFVVVSFAAGWANGAVNFGRAVVDGYATVFGGDVFGAPLPEIPFPSGAVLAVSVIIAIAFLDAVLGIFRAVRRDYGPDPLPDREPAHTTSSSSQKATS